MAFNKLNKNRDLNGLNSPLSYMGINAIGSFSASQTVTLNRVPTTSDYKNFVIGCVWIIPSTSTNPAIPNSRYFYLAALINNEATWVELGNLSVGILSVLGDAPISVSTIAQVATVSLDNGTNGQVLIGGGATPTWGTLTSSDSSVIFTTGPNALDFTIDIAAAGGVEGLTGDAGGLVSPTVGGNITLSGGTNINTVGTPNTITINLDDAISLATSVTSPLYTAAIGDIVLNMTDDAGLNVVSFTNNSDVEVAYINSLGASLFSEIDVDNININGNTIISSNINGNIVLTPNGTGSVNINYLTQYTLPIAGSLGAINDLADGIGANGHVLTSNGAGAEPTWQPSGGGAGLLTQSFTLTSVQVKNLVATPILLIAAPPAGSFIQVIQTSAKLNYGGTSPFIAGGAPTKTLQLYYSSSFTPWIVTDMLQGIGASTDYIQAYTLFPGVPPANDAVDIEARAVYVRNSSGVEYSGNAANDNTVTGEILYRIVTL